MKGLIGSVNSVTAALGSSVLTALAISEQMRQEHLQRLELQAKLENTYEAMPIGLFTLDLQGRFTRSNPALFAQLGPQVLAEGHNLWEDYFSQHDWDQMHHLVHCAKHGELEVSSKKNPGPSGAKRFLVKATLAHGKIEGSLQDITEKSRAMEELSFLANHDSLTKVLNRRGIGRQLDLAIDRVQNGQLLSLGYLDLDRFKLINDLYGHGAGDEVLRQVCDRITIMISGDVHFGRVGGDEFVLVCPGMPIELATLLCRGIIDGISTLPYQVGDKAFYLRGSIGLVEVGPGMKVNDAMSSADRACRQAKSATPTGLVVYEKDALAFELHEAELKLIALLATPAATDGLYLEMQPIMSLTAPHDSLNFEVLLRMRDALGKVVRTDHLIAAGEASGRMGMIDRWVLKTTLAWLQLHWDQLNNTRFVCMNLSGASLNDEKFLEDVYATLEQNLPIVSKLCLEITESVALHDVNNTRRFVNKVRGYGAKVALDDFGAGYTSFSYLKEFTADLLKIDGSFIVNMNHHPANVAIVEAIVNLAKNLGMKVIAEWAEDQQTVQTLVEIGVDYVQGFIVARPQHPDTLLSAQSSASFIKDAALIDMMERVGQPDVLGRTMMDFTLTPTSNMH
jgi:diguanylate cyclase (GGDEF)-like protein